MRVVPLKTAPLVPGDDVSTVAKGALEAAGLEPDPSDVLVVRGSSLAVTQGRVVDVAEVRPTPVARLLCRLCRSDSFLANPYSFQVAVDLAGLTRILLALAVDRYSRLLDRGPDFHRVAGRQVAWMDDTVGSLAPHARGIVLGPHDPRRVACSLAASMGCGVAVVKTDDSGRVEICGASPFIDHDRLIEATRPKPGSDADERTPLLLVRS